MASAQQHLVLAFFENEKTADRAVEALQAWDQCSDEIKYGAIGVLVKDPDGKLKEHRFGPRRCAKAWRSVWHWALSPRCCRAWDSWAASSPVLYWVEREAR